MAVSKFKDFGKSNICKKFIEAYKPIFDAYPESEKVKISKR